MGRIILGLLASLLVVCSLQARATALEPLLHDLLLRPPPPEYAWWTLKTYPSLCWILINRPPVGATMIFTLMDSRSIKLEVQLPSTLQTETNETYHCVNLKDYNIQLEPDILYRWSVSIAQNRESHSRDVVGRGHIQRCGEESCLIREMPSRRCDVNFVQVLARSGMWYDSISCLCDLVKSSPKDMTLRRMLNNLMWQAGLTLDPN